MNQFSIYRRELTLPVHKFYVMTVEGETRTQVKRDFCKLTGWPSEDVTVELFDLELFAYCDRLYMYLEDHR